MEDKDIGGIVDKIAWKVKYDKMFKKSRSYNFHCIFCNCWDLDDFCPSGYNSIPENLDGTGKLWASSDSSRTIDACSTICNKRQGCTGFEFASGISEAGACATYTGGASNKKSDENRLSSKSNWRSCIKIANGIIVLSCE